MTALYELVIVGGGPAGLAAALAAGRARIRCLLIDSGSGRNAVAAHIHTFLNSDHLAPAQFRQQAHDQMKRYASVEMIREVVQSIDSHTDRFALHLRNGRRIEAGRVLLAVGVVDELPDIAGLADYWGKGIHHCPYCDGFEYADRTWGLLAHDEISLSYALFLTAWTTNVTVFLHKVTPSHQTLQALTKSGITIVRGAVARLEGRDGLLKEVVLADGSRRAIDALWVHPRHRQTALIESLALTLDSDGAVQRDEQGQTSLPGVYAAGDLCATQLQQAILAAADGTRVAYSAIHDIVMQRFNDAQDRVHGIAQVCF